MSMDDRTGAARDLYVECATGISGDMAVAALLDVGADEAALRRTLDSIPVEGFRVEISRVSKGGVDCCDFNVVLDAAHENHDHDMDYLYGHEQGAGQGHHDGGHGHGGEHGHHHEDAAGHSGHGEGGHRHGHRGLADIRAVIAATSMTDGARVLADKMFSILAAAEAKAHGVPPEQVHFHEVGAVDSIVDVIALATCFDSLHVRRVYVPRLCEGGGTVRCQHGILPVPVPAVANIAAAYGLPLQVAGEGGELVTPTGAAFAAAVMTHAELPGRFAVRAVGMGAGKRAYRRPSILRAMLIEELPPAALPPDGGEDAVYKLETNIDDCTGEALGFVMDELLAAGARDVHFIPCYMKKNRPAVLLTVICSRGDVPRMEEIIFAHTTTIGIRRVPMERTVLPRSAVTVRTEWGEARAKEVAAGGAVRRYPEHDDVAAISRRTGVPYARVYAAVAAAQPEGGTL